MRGTVWSYTFFTLLLSRGGGPDDMRGTVWSRTFFHLLSSRGGESDDMRGNLMVPHLFFHYPETIKSDSMQRQIMVIRILLLSVRLNI